MNANANACQESVEHSTIIEFGRHRNKWQLPHSDANADISALAYRVFSTFPPELVNEFSVRGASQDYLLRLIQWEIGNNLPNAINRAYIYGCLRHAMSVTQNPKLKPLIAYFAPTKKDIMQSIRAFYDIKQKLPTEFLESCGLSSLNEIPNIVLTAFNGEESGIKRLQDVRKYLKNANEEALEFYLRISIYEPFLIYIDFIQTRE